MYFSQSYLGIRCCANSLLLLYLVIAVFGAYKSLAIEGAGIAVHCGYDIFQVFYLSNNVAPNWCAPYCATLDFVLGFWVIDLFKSRDLPVNESFVTVLYVLLGSSHRHVVPGDNNIKLQYYVGVYPILARLANSCIHHGGGHQQGSALS